MDSEELYEKYCEERDEFIDKLFIENPIKVTVKSTQTFFLDNRFVDTDDLFYNMSEGITFKEYMTSVIEAVIDEYEDVKEGKLMPEEVNEACIERYLDTHDIPDPDLLIRTSGEQRLSNYLLWQLAYTEFYFTDVPWPDFSKQELEKAIEQYNRRDRRYGGVKEE